MQYRSDEDARQRATVLIIENGLVLLTRDKGMDMFILPGGGINEGESREDGAARELREETGLVARDFTFVMSHRSPVASHHVFIPGVIEGTPIASREIEQITWWDGVQPLRTTSSVVPILSDPRIGFLAAT